MTDHTHDLSFDEYDEVNSPRPELTDFDAVVEARMNRRTFVGGTAAAVGATALLGSTAMSTQAEAASGGASRLDFDQVPANTLDTITVPNGYNWHTVVMWGQPLWSDGPDFDQVTRGTGASQERAFGDNNDGMWMFNHDGHHLLVVNNEYSNRSIIYHVEGKAQNADDVRKTKAAHGISVMEVVEKDDQWHVVMDSPYNRRITADTPMNLTGPARGHDLMKTSGDITGTIALGTWNNCGNGYTPWGTYLTCEENFNGYFGSQNPEAARDDVKIRYGVNVEDWGYGWFQHDDRFDIEKEPNESHRFGYIVEIDPTDPNSMPQKRTALGRFKHENAELVVNPNGQVVVYMGDDERGEFLYKWVSRDKMVTGGDNGNLLVEGTLFVAKFHDNGRGEWLALTPATTGMTEAEIAIKTRMAASSVGATTMDRPEWVAANPHTTDVYCCLTNNRNRGVKANAGGDEAPVNGPNPRAENHYGQIVRWAPMDQDHTKAEFEWDLFVVAGNPTVHSDAYAGSANINADNMFNSPDGLFFDSKGLIWIQTDGNYGNEGDFAGQGNNQMLVGDPITGEIKRFLTGPNECEITGVAWAADRRTLFVGIQHPGERGGTNSNWPEGGSSVPRSAVIGIRRNDGAVIG